MEPFKRKRRSDGDSEAGDPRRPPPPLTRPPPPPPAAEEDDRAVTDDEVEEFFSILSRMHEASRCLDARPRPAPAARGVVDNGVVPRWSPTFAWEDFAAPKEAMKHDDGSRRIGGEEGEEEELPKAPSPAPAAAEDGETVAENTTPRFFDLNAFPEESDGLVVANPRGEVPPAALMCALSDRAGGKTRRVFDK